jgi:hypothetical protein
VNLFNNVQASHTLSEDGGLDGSNVIFMPHPRAVVVVQFAKVVGHSVTRYANHHFTPGAFRE